MLRPELTPGLGQASRQVAAAWRQDFFSPIFHKLDSKKETLK